jgi:ribonuclease P protein component
VEGGDAGARKRRRLSRSGDFDRVFREGFSHATRHLVVYSFPREQADDAPAIRLGISVSRKVGGSVARNRVKRALREAFWSLGDRLPRGHDFVIVARPDAAALVEREGAEGIRRHLLEALDETAQRER